MLLYAGIFSFLNSSKIFSFHAFILSFPLLAWTSAVSFSSRLSITRLLYLVFFFVPTTNSKSCLIYCKVYSPAGIWCCCLVSALCLFSPRLGPPGAPPSPAGLTTSDACEVPTFCLRLSLLAPSQRLSGTTEPSRGNDSLITRAPLHSPSSFLLGVEKGVSVCECERDGGFHCFKIKNQCSCGSG